MLVKAKAPHICAECHKRIEVGELYEDIAEKVNGKWEHIRTHLTWPRDMATVEGIKVHVLGVVYNPVPVFLCCEWTRVKYHFYNELRDVDGRTVTAKEMGKQCANG